MQVLFLLLLCLLHAKIVRSLQNESENPYNGIDSFNKEEGWSDWSEWSACTRTCGGGVAIQSRRCLHIQGCRGNSVRYNVCNLDVCPKDVPDLLSQQCSEYDSIPYNSQLHQWEPAEGDSPCALTCRAKGQDGPPVVLNSRVMDGTRCANYTEGMCVHGQCQVIGCDLILGSPKKKDVCGVCGGDGSSCRKTHWVKRGLGPCSATCGGGYRVVTVTCKDVLSGQEVDAKLCSHTPKPSQIVVNCGDKPCPAEWKTEDWEPCSVPCGNGYQLREVACVERRNSSTIRVADHECTDSRPPHRISCGGNECPRWYEGIWSECSVTCGEGVQRRAVQCRFSSGISSNDCTLELRPDSTRPCRTGARCPPTVLAHPRHIIEKWPRESEETANFLPSEQPLSHEQKVPAEPTFIASDWSSCSKTCGEGVQTREVTCKIFLEFSRTVAVLPDSQCPGARPVEAKRCYTRSCSSVMMSEPSKEHQDHSKKLTSFEHTNTDVISGHSMHHLRGSVPLKLQSLETEENIPNDYEAFRAPSPNSQETPRIIPLEKKEKNSLSLSRLEGTYHVYPFEDKYVWKSAGFTECSASCLAGVQESISYCIRAKDQKRVSSMLCDRNSRMDSITRTCNDHPCPPQWEESPFEPCSKSCGGGITRRQVRCVHQVTMSKTSKLVVPNSQCEQPPPYAQKFCNMTPCPPTWSKGKWSDCSVTCGRGYRTRGVDCVQTSSLGQTEKVSSYLCETLGAPTSRKGCSNSPCVSSVPRRRRKKGPMIKTQPSQNYFQKKFMKTVNLRIGGQASVFHGAKIKIKCPVRRFNRQFLTWWRNGKRIGEKRIRRFRVTKNGILKINRIQYTDAAVYICKAGEKEANLTLKVQPLPSSFANVEEDADGNDVYSGGTKDKPKPIKFHESPFFKSGFELVDEDSYKAKPRERIFGVKEDSSPFKKVLTPPNENEGEDSLLRLMTGSRRPIVYGTLAHHGSRNSNSEGGISLLSDKVGESKRREGFNLKAFKNSQRAFGTLFNDTRNPNQRSKDGDKMYFGTLIHKLNVNETETDQYMRSDASHVRGHTERSAQHRGSMFDLIADAASDSGFNSPQFLGKGSRDSLQFEWKVTNWTECSQTCSFSGSSGGYQVRSMQCVVRVNNVSQVVEGALCEDAGLSAPPTIQQCGSEECPRWKVDNWSDCENSRCFTLHYAFQKRQVTCLLHNGTIVPNSFCDVVTKPRHRRECYNRQCVGVWRTGDWSKCTAPCGGQGYRTRLLQCVWNGTKKSAGNACREQSRPEVVRWCDGKPCSTEEIEKPEPESECQDMSRYCKIVQRINMCRVKLYREKCCRSCQ